MNQPNPTLSKTLNLIPLVNVALLITAATASAQPYAFSRTFDNPTPTVSDVFGISMALDGNHVLIGSHKDTNGLSVGQVQLFDATTGSLLQTFADPTPNGDEFGSSVALDGNRVLVGTSSDDTNGANVGQAYLFDTTSGNLLHTFNDPTPTPNGSLGDEFGKAVALDGNRVLVGASDDDTNGVEVGQAHLFDATTGSLLQTFDDPTITGADFFGSSVALDGNRVLVGAPYDDTNGTNVGQAHLFVAIPTPDFSGDGVLDCIDIDALVAEIAAGTNSSLFDLTGDGLVDTADLDEWRVQGGASNLPSGNPYLVGRRQPGWLRRCSRL